jgi:hypothetical protein
MLSLDDVRVQLERVDLQVDGIAFRWNVSGAWEDAGDVDDREDLVKIGYFIQIEYDEADIDDPSGPLMVQQGRRWFVGLDVSKTEVIQTALKAALASAEHRTREWFLVDGVRAYGPHQDVDDLVAVLKSGGRFITESEIDAIHSDGSRQGLGS